MAEGTTSTARENLTASANIQTAAREIDFVTRFNDTWKQLRDIMGISRPIVKAPGTALKVKKASIVLNPNPVGEGEFITRSQATVTENIIGEMTLEKYAKEVSAEAVMEHGAADAVARTDKAFLKALTGVIMGRFYTFLKTGTLKPSTKPGTFQGAIAKAIGLVKNAFQTMGLEATEVALFVNTMDVYDYLGTANITIQSKFGMDYIENFMGAKIVFLSSEIDAGTVIATPVDNIIMYYVNPGNADFKALGLNYTVIGETPLVGFHAEGDYDHATGVNYALMGVHLMAEYIDGIAVVEFGA